MKKISTKREVTTLHFVLMVLLAIAMLAVSQGLAFLLGDLLVKIGLPQAVGNVLIGIFYVGFTYLGISVVCRRVLKQPLKAVGLDRFWIKKFWLFTAIAMPLFVLLIAMGIGGKWQMNVLTTGKFWELLTADVFIFGMAGGFVEEAVFRGVIMTSFSERFNRSVAVVVPSVIFGALHIIGNDLDLGSIIQLLIAGTVVGILFSLITLESGSIWSSALVHGLWNVVIGGSLIHIGPVAIGNTIFNFILKAESFLLTGGDFGIEASLISVIVYLLFILLAWKMLRSVKK
ncbi:type II CAAX endopeptidase family protein [Enterococcus hirae]|nr:type II CAAX endopeptidase family protein [Enterococcus hirae]